MLTKPVFHDIPQNEEIWFGMRSGKLTSSNLGKVMAVSNDYKVLAVCKDCYAIADTVAGKLRKERYEAKLLAESAIKALKRKDIKKAFGTPAKQYAVQIAIEQITGNPISSNYSNAHMERGHEQEPLARMAYEDHTFSEVTNGGFYDLGFVGCSADGFADNGAIEIKSVIESVHFANVSRANVDPAYKWQCIANMKFTERPWLDFISYCDTYPIDKKLFIYRLNEADYQDEYKMIDERVALFYELVQKTKASILSSDYHIQSKAA